MNKHSFQNSAYTTTTPNGAMKTEKKNAVDWHHLNGAMIADHAKHALDQVVTSGKTAIHDANDALVEVEHQIQKRPYIAMSAVAGVTFGLGAFMGSKFLRMAALLGGGYALVRLMNTPTGAKVGAKVKNQAERIADDFTR